MSALGRVVSAGHQELLHLGREFDRLARGLLAVAGNVLGRWREILLALAYLAGWALITWGVARLTVPEAWLISGGLLLLSLGGVGLLKDVAIEGLYVLSSTRRRR